jgi:cytochrome P450
MAAKGGECDFSTDIALLFPLRVIMEILGISRDEEARMLRLTQELFSNGDPDFARDGADPEQQNVQLEAILDMVTYFNSITEDRRKNPTDDLATQIANGKINDAPIGELEAMGYYVIISSAGHDTTSATIAGGLWALCENPEEFTKLKADPTLIGNFVEESVRWVTPVKHFMRTAAEDVEFNGQQISKGDWLMLCYSSANRDADQFDDPFSFRVDRNDARNIAFGFGPHVCLGQHLSRMEMRIFWEELLPRLESVELAGTPARVESSFVCGLKTLPIRFRIR